MTTVTTIERWYNSSNVVATYLLVECDLPIQMLLRKPSEVLDLLRVIGIHFGHGGIQHRLAARSYLFILLHINREMSIVDLDHTHERTRPSRIESWYRDKVDLWVSTTG